MSISGVRLLRQRFNEVAGDKYTATLALLDYRREHDVEWQVLTFRGTCQNGDTFEVTSRHIAPGEDVNDVAAETARDFLTQGAKAP
jgi:hypothetical protein